MSLVAIYAFLAPMLSLSYFLARANVCLSVAATMQVHLFKHTLSHFCVNRDKPTHTAVTDTSHQPANTLLTLVSIEHDTTQHTKTRHATALTQSIAQHKSALKAHKF